jgi:hypothetical protein
MPIEFAGPSIGFALAGLHLDHEYDVRHICDTWRHVLRDG